MEIKLNGKLSAEDIEDVFRLVRTKWYWPRLIVRNLYGALFLGALLWATVAGLMKGERLNWRGLGLIWAFLLFLVVFLYFRTRQARAKDISRMAAALPDHITVDAKGLHFDGPNGASGFQPWASYRRWREGKRTVVVEYAAHKGFAMLPVSALSQSELQVLRGFLDSQLE
jgi:hypothetical protein